MPETNAVPHTSVIDLEPADADLAFADRLLDLAPEPDLWAMEQTRRSLVAHELERWHERPSPRRRRELDTLIAREVESLITAIKLLMCAAERTPG
jgi:hypothetical protein